MKLWRVRVPLRRTWALAGAAALLLASAVPGTAPVLAGSLTVTPALPTGGSALWTNQQNLFFNVGGALAAPPSATFDGCPPACPGPAGGASPVQGTMPGPFTFNLFLVPFTQGTLTVAAATYQVSAPVGEDPSILEEGPPSGSAVSFTIFGHAGTSVSSGSVQLQYNNSPVTPTSVTPNGNGVTVSYSTGVTAGANVSAQYADTSGNQYAVSFQAATPTADPAWITGQVTNASGTPLAGAQVQAFGPGAFGQVYTGGDGHFLLPIGGTGTFTLQVTPLGALANTYTQYSTQVTLSSGANALPSAIQLPVAALTVSGTVYDGVTNQPLTGAFVNLFLPPPPVSGPGGAVSPPPAAGGSAMTNQAGQFTIPLASTGDYQMMVQPPFKNNSDALLPYGPQQENLTASTSLSIGLNAANATVTGTVYQGGLPVSQGGLMAFSPTGGTSFAPVQPNGSYTLELPAGTWQLQVNGMSPVTQQPLQGLQTKQTVTPSADLQGGALVIGASTGQSLTDDITLAPYDVPVDVVPLVGGVPPAKAFVVANQGAAPSPGSGPSSGPGASPGPAGIFANPFQNSDGTTGDYSSTGHLHLHLTAGTWQLGIGVQSGSLPPRFRMVQLTITGSGTSATVAADGRHVSVTAGSGSTPAAVGVAFAPLNQTVTATVYANVGGSPAPVSGAFVGAFDGNGNFLPGNGNPPITNAAGQETVNISKGLWHVVVQAPGYGFAMPQTVDTTGGLGAYSVKFNLGTPRPYTISGTVTINGTPVPGAGVVARQPGQVPAVAPTDPLGNFSISVGSGNWSLGVVQARGFDTSGLAPVVTSQPLGSTNTKETVNLSYTSVAQQNITVTGTVYGPDGSPFGTSATTQGQLATVEADSGNGSPAVAMVANDGTWQLTLGPGTWSFRAHAPGYTHSAPVGQNLTSAQDNTTVALSQNLTLGSSLPDTISGTVTDAASGAGIDNALVTVVDAANHTAFQTLTGSSGTYSVAVADGTYTVRAGAVGYAVANSTAPATVSASGTSSATVNLALSAGVAVSGTVTSSSGAAAGVEVDATNNATSPALVVTTSTDASGNYILPLTPGTWSLQAGSAASQSAVQSVTVGTQPLTNQNLTLP